MLRDPHVERWTNHQDALNWGETVYRDRVLEPMPWLINGLGRLIG